jgi:hypothetical protein
MKLSRLATEVARRRARTGSRAWGKGSCHSAQWVRPAVRRRPRPPDCRSRAGWIRRLVAAHPHPVAGQHVGSVGEGRDPPEALGLALGAEHAAGFVEAHELGVGARRDRTSVSTVAASPRSGPEHVILVPVIDRHAVDADAQDLSRFGVEPERQPVLAIALDLEGRAHHRPLAASSSNSRRSRGPASRAGDTPRA